MCNRNRPSALAGQQGFSMIELLMTAFVLSIGLLGLCMLQTMSLRASRGGQSLTTAVHVAEAVMDQVELEGRMSWLNKTEYSLLAQPGALPAPFYLTLAAGSGGGVINQTFNIQGYPPTTSTNPAVSNPFFQVTTTRVDDVGAAGGSGQLSDFRVAVVFNDSANGVPRQVIVTRRIVHG